MSINAWELHYIIIGCLDVLLLLFLNALMVRNFLRKRTVGTNILLNLFATLLIAEVLFTTSFFLQIYLPTEQISKAVKIMQLVAVIMLMYSVHWIYFFSNRHLIRDNDLIKAYFSGSLSLLAGLIIGIAIFEVIAGGSNPNWYEIYDLAGTNLEIYYPAMLPPQSILIYVLILIVVSTYIRIIIRTVRLQRKAKDIVTKKGLRVVSASLIGLVAIGLTLGGYIFGVGRYPVFAALTYVIHGIAVMAAIILSYLGWVMPDWLRRRFRGKTWIEKIYTGKITPPNKKDISTTKAVEVTEA
jgi:hypothetical protein